MKITPEQVVLEDLPMIDLLSSKDAERFKELGVVLQSAKGKLLTLMDEEGLKLVETTTDGSIPYQSIIPVSRLSEFMKIYTGLKRQQYIEKYGRLKVSLTLADYIWPFEEGDDQIELWSTVPYFPPPGQLTIVSSSNGERKKGVGEYCLAACEDGTVKWLHKSECENKTNHVWKVHWFDLRGGGVVYFGDRLQRPLRNVCINVVNKIIGANINLLGTQNIGPVNC